MTGPNSTSHTSFDAKLRDLEKGCFLVAFCGGVSEYFRKKDFSMCNNGISALRTFIVEGIVDCYEYLFTNLIEWNRITCKT